jgi:uncharacterized membrane protein YgcG
MGLGREANQPSELVLPDRMGMVNDYANQINGTEQIKLDEKLRQWLDEFGVEMVVLTSIIDPVGSAAAYADKMIEAWELGDKAILLLFARAGVDKWSYELRIGREAEALFHDAGDKLVKLRSRLDFFVKRKSISAGVQESVATFEGLLQKQEELPPIPSDPWWRALVSSLPGTGLLLLGIAGMVGVSLGVRFVMRRLCPRCGRRLQNYRGPARSYRRSGQYLSCPHCGYGRMR